MKDENAQARFVAQASQAIQSAGLKLDPTGQGELDHIVAVGIDRLRAERTGFEVDAGSWKTAEARAKLLGNLVVKYAADTNTRVVSADLVDQVVNLNCKPLWPFCWETERSQSRGEDE